MANEPIQSFSSPNPDTSLPSIEGNLAAYSSGSLSKYVDQLLGPNDDSNAIINSITTSMDGSPIAVRSQFLHLLDNWEFSLPLNQLWMVFFTIPRLVTSEALKAYGETIYNDPDQSGVNLARERLTADQYMKSIGCAFAQTVTIPQEQNAIEKIGPSNRGFLKAPVLTQRQQFASINIEFLESNLSFVDFLIRPWIILSSHLGYVARGPEQNVGVDMMVINFAKGGVDFERSPYTPARSNGATTDSVNIRNRRGFVPRKMFLFQGCTPINMRPERYGYSPEGQVDRRDTEWSFRRYQVMSPREFANNMDDYHVNEEEKTKKFWNGHREALQKELRRHGDTGKAGFDESYNADDALLEHKAGIVGNAAAGTNAEAVQKQYEDAQKNKNTYVRQRTGTRPGGFNILNFLGL